MTEQATTTEIWLYAGQRYHEPKKKTYHVWVDPAGEELHFTKTLAGMPGGAYTVEVKRRADGISMVGSPRYLAEQGDRHATPVQEEKWRAEDRAAKQRVEDLRTEKRLGADTEIDRALEVLRRHRARLGTYAKRGAFDSYVLGEVQRPPQEPREEE